MESITQKIEGGIRGERNYFLRTMRHDITTCQPSLLSQVQTPLHHDDGGASDLRFDVREMRQRDRVFGTRSAFQRDNESDREAERPMDRRRLLNAIALQAWVHHGTELQSHYDDALEFLDSAELVTA